RSSARRSPRPRTTRAPSRGTSGTPHSRPRAGSACPPRAPLPARRRTTGTTRRGSRRAGAGTGTSRSPAGSAPLYGNGVSLPGGTVTFLFTDIEGSTQLLRDLGDDYGLVLADQRRILRETLGGGRSRGRHAGRRVLLLVPAREGRRRRSGR